MTPLYYAMKKAKQERNERRRNAILYAAGTILLWLAGCGFLLFVNQLMIWLHI